MFFPLTQKFKPQTFKLSNKNIHVSAGLLPAAQLQLPQDFQDLQEFQDLKDDCPGGFCSPQLGDLMLGRAAQLSASSTCGLHGPQNYCIIGYLEVRGHVTLLAVCVVLVVKQHHRVSLCVEKLQLNWDLFSAILTCFWLMFWLSYCNKFWSVSLLSHSLLSVPSSFRNITIPPPSNVSLYG